MNPSMTKEEVIALLQSEIDECKEVAVSTDEQYRSADCSGCARTKAMIEVLNRCTEWTPCEERMPTKEDGRQFGNIHLKLPDGRIRKIKVEEAERYYELYPRSAWSRIEPQGGGNG